MRNINHKYPVFGVFLMIVLSSLLVSAFQPETNRNISIAFDYIGVISGIILIVMMIKTLKSFNSSLRQNYDFMLVIGIFFQVLAFTYTLIFIRFKLYPMPTGIDIHHLLMIIGFLFFGIATYKLRILAGTINKKS